MNEKENEKKNKNIINSDEKSTKNIKMKKIIKKRFSRKKENLNIIIFDDVNMKNANAQTFMIFCIDNTTTTSNIIMKFSFEFESLKKKENPTQTNT